MVTYLIVAVSFIYVLAIILFIYLKIKKNSTVKPEQKTVMQKTTFTKPTVNAAHSEKKTYTIEELENIFDQDTDSIIPVMVNKSHKENNVENHDIQSEEHSEIKTDEKRDDNMDFKTAMMYASIMDKKS